ncbi:hypothetical protein [Croceicoccus naphthovorans]|uniref:Uncharacterized protein n=1 Tax=Croceicoccus naphthovorans TaxID=1348774 RepID=A0A0G3XG05_9SPHN|nr:hypothetical protein [Croceicoccus naphthovorans]AKM09328.1 hypothetical protein AB433_03980 [Croceicoccus naphthovorans]MBB3990239.1 hypothetical protein [Croceicoccus naphthovorans]
MNATAWPAPVREPATHVAPRLPHIDGRKGRDQFNTILALAFAAALLGLLLALRQAGYMSLATLELWGRALLATEGTIRAPSVAAAHPPLPYLFALTGNLFASGFGSAWPVMITALFFGLMVAGWSRAFRTEGFHAGAALFAIVLLATNPILLRSLAEGPGWAVMHCGLSMLAIGLFNLRRDHRITDVILVALALPVIMLSDPIGIVIVVAAIPAIALCVPDAQMRRSPIGVMLTMLFPGAFVFAGFGYTNWIFNGDPWAFLGGFTALLTAPPVSEKTLSLALSGLVATAPIISAMIVRTRRQRGVRRAAVGVTGAIVLAAIAAWAIRMWPSSVQMAALGIPLAMASATRWPRNRDRGEKPILALLAIGWTGGAVLVWAAPDAESERMRAALTGSPVPAADAELAALGMALQGHGEVLFDAEAAPAAIAYRGGAGGIDGASSMRFRIDGLRQTSFAPVQVVRSHRAPQGADAMGRTFPHLHEHGLPGYRLLHDGPQWRAWIKDSEQ